MVTQQIFLPMVPDSAPIVVNISQYDFDAAGYAGRLFFNLVNEGASYDMDGASALFQGEKPDGTTFAYMATVVNASVVRVNVRQQMTTVAGRVVCQLVLSNNDGQIGSFNIWLEVQPSSASGGDPSQTDIPALIAQAKEYADIAEQAAQDASAWSANPPYIGANGNWFVYDTATSTYTDTGVYASGSEGNRWYTGTAVSGKDSTPTVFPTGITLAREGDMYLNKTEGAIYHCTLGGADTVAKWAYDMTLTGGGGGGTDDYVDLMNKPQMNGVTLIGNKSTGDLIPLGDGLAFDPISLELSTDLLAGSNITLTPQASGAIMISATGGGGGGGGLSNAFDEVEVNGISLIASGGDTLHLLAGSNISLTPNAGTNTVEIASTGGGGGGHTMIPNNTAITSLTAKATDNTDDDVASGYAIANWSNAEITTLVAHISQNNDTVGAWNDAWKTDGIRTGWVWHECLYDIVSDNEVEISIDFDVAGEEVVGLYAYRVDDSVTQTIGGQTVNGGAIAIKLTSPIQNASGVDVAINLKRQRTNLVTNPTILS